MDTLAAMPYTTRIILGGMIGPMHELAAVTAALYAAPYPSSFIAGIKMDPTAAVSATAAPVMPAKNTLTPMFTSASAPGILPNKTIQKSTNFLEIPDLPINSPAKMKNGTARRGNESSPTNMYWGIAFNGIMPCAMIVTNDDIPITNAIGTPNSSVIKKVNPNVAIITYISYEPVS